MTQQNDRFQGFQQLVGDAAFQRISKASVCIIGLGGVGSWAAEGLARSGVGAITLVDLDDVCITNVNRQLQALTSNVGRSKADALAERISDINPECAVRVEKKFFTKSSASAVLGQRFDLVIDTIDSVDHKTELIVECVRRDLPLISAGSGGNRLDPLAVTVEDFAFTDYDPMLQIVRKRLRRNFNFPRGERKRFCIPCVFAPLQRGPRVRLCSAEGVSPTRGTKKTCNDGLGSAAFMTGTIGLVVAAEAIKVLAMGAQASVYPWKEKRWNDNFAVNAA